MNKQDVNEVLKDINWACSNPDLIEIEIEDGFFYKTEKIGVDNSKIETGWGKKPEDGWIPLLKAKGHYCGFNSVTENDFNLKIRVKEPFYMPTYPGNYIVVPVSNLLSIKKVG